MVMVDKHLKHKALIMFCHPTMQSLCEKIADINDNIEYRKTGIEWKKFPDGFPNIFINDIQTCRGRNVIFVASFHQLPIIFEQLSVVYALPKSSVKSLTFVLPYFPTGTMERVETEGQIATASSMARMLSAMPLSMNGPAQILIYDIHALQERFFFSDHVIPQLLSAIPSFLKTLEDTNKEWCIAFPDEGAYKRFDKYFSKFKIIRCIKKRYGNSREVTIVEGDPSGSHVVVVDDLIMTGGTMLECIKTIQKHGSLSVSAYVTHAVFPENSWRKFCDNLDVLENFWITDSIPHANEIAKNKPFKLISLAESISNAICLT